MQLTFLVCLKIANAKNFNWQVGHLCIPHQVLIFYSLSTYCIKLNSEIIFNFIWPFSKACQSVNIVILLKKNENIQSFRSMQISSHLQELFKNCWVKAKILISVSSSLMVPIKAICKHEHGIIPSRFDQHTLPKVYL